MSSTGKTIAQISSSLTNNCEKVVNWMKSNQFKLNASKTHLMTVGTVERLCGLQVRLKLIWIMFNSNKVILNPSFF